MKFRNIKMCCKDIFKSPRCSNKIQYFKNVEPLIIIVCIYYLMITLQL